MSDLSIPLPNSNNNYKETYFVIHKDQLMEKFFEITKTDPRMNEKQKKAFYRQWWDLVEQEPTLEEMDSAYMSYIAHFDHIPSTFAFVKHFNRFRTGIMPNKKGESLKKIEAQQSELKMQQWIRELEEKD